MFTLEIKDEGDQLRLIPRGEMDMYYTPQFKQEALNAYEKDQKNILIDAEDLNYLDSTGLGGFIYLMNAVKQNGHAISLAHLQPNVEKLFTITKLDKVFDIKGEA
ncbi:MAG: STAS domain-containing protein [Peptoniphilus sp.]|nr:STAS domain-containing protein [Peptoniphilus sp.]MDD7363531.1 STAS domain-containing protein [Bacillota bacterium]MDY6044766.1 STAS domain-containing protein [Peptoniphilus sp.]